MPAVANAVFDAVGVRIDQVPIAPHMIRQAIEARDKGKEARFGPKSFPHIDFGVPLMVPTPDEDGDGKAINVEEAGVRSGTPTMTERKNSMKEDN